MRCRRNVMMAMYVVVIIYLDLSHTFNIRQRRDESSNTVSCSQPLGIIRDSINIRVGFSVDNASESEDNAIDNGLLSALLRVFADIVPESSPVELDQNSYIQIQFAHVKLLSGILTQGIPGTSSRVTHFKVMYSMDCAQYSPVLTKQGTIAEFVGNLFANSTMTVMFDQVFSAKCVRVVPTRRVGTDNAMRFEFLGCEPDNCHSPLTESELTERGSYKQFAFDKEKIISAISISLVPGTVLDGVPAFILGYSRTCNFDDNGHIVQNNGSSIYNIADGESSVVVADGAFPLRAQCVAVTSHIQPDQYTVHFQGCDALNRHDALDSCGKTHVSDHSLRRRKRVVGGTPSIPGEWPWLVSLHFLDVHDFTTRSGLPHLCGASLIHPQWVLTAAHCVDEIVGAGLANKSNWLVVLGEHLQSGRDGTEQRIPVEKIVKHPQFILAEDHEVLYDIALFKLAKPAQLSDYVNTICIEPNYTFPDYTTCVTAGWGDTENDGIGVELPHHVALQIVPSSLCAELYGTLPEGHATRMTVANDDLVMCATASESGKDSCQGDSGGPLMCYHNDHWVLTGLVSIGQECGDLRFPGIYTRVNHYYEWIQQTINGDHGI